MTSAEHIGKRAGFTFALVLAVVASYFVFERWFERIPFPEGLIQANGRLEGDQVIVAAKQPGRIAQLLAREGNTVTADSTLVMLDDAQVRARAMAAQACRRSATPNVCAVYVKKAQPLCTKQKKPNSLPKWLRPDLPRPPACWMT